jgi:hypothetical protein
MWQRRRVVGYAAAGLCLDWNCRDDCDLGGDWGDGAADGIVASEYAGGEVLGLHDSRQPWRVAHVQAHDADTE